MTYFNILILPRTNHASFLGILSSVNKEWELIKNMAMDTKVDIIWNLKKKLLVSGLNI